MPKWPRTDEARRPYRITRAFDATYLDPRNESAFNHEEEFYEPPTTISAGSGIQADPRALQWQGGEVIVFSREYNNFFVGKSIFLGATEPI
jgi:hypothetical protein